MSSPEIRWAGPRALLLELDSLDAVLSLHSRLRDNPAAGQVDVLAAARTVLVVFDSRASARAARGPLARPGSMPAGAAAVQDTPVRIEVVYDGEDLAEVGELTGMGPEGVVAEFVDDLVRATDLRRGVRREWREWELELGPAAPVDPAGREALFAAAEQAIFAAGGREAASGSKLARALGF